MVLMVSMTEVLVDRMGLKYLVSAICYLLLQLRSPLYINISFRLPPPNPWIPPRTHQLVELLIILVSLKVTDRTVASADLLAPF